MPTSLATDPYADLLGLLGLPSEKEEEDDDPYADLVGLLGLDAAPAEPSFDTQIDTGPPGQPRIAYAEAGTSPSTAPAPISRGVSRTWDEGTDERGTPWDQRRDATRSRFRRESAVAPLQRMRTVLPPDEEADFQEKYANLAAQAGLDPDPDHPLQKYDYRGWYRAWKADPASVSVEVDPTDGLPHFPSRFKDPDHPTRFVKGEDTIAADRPPRAPTAVERALITGLIEQNPQTAGYALEALGLLFGSDRLEDLSKELKAAKGPGKYKTSELRWNDVRDINQAMTYLGESLGQGMASTIPSLVGGVAGTVAGAVVGAGVGAGVGAVAAGPPGAVFGAGVGVRMGATWGGRLGAGLPAYVLNMGDLFESLQQEGVERNKAARLAAEWAVPISALDVLGLESIAKIFKGGARKQVMRSLARRIAAASAKGAAFEGVTEGFQQMIQESVLEVSGETEVPLVTRLVRVVDSIIAGALTGGVMAAPAGISRRSEARQTQVNEEQQRYLAKLLQELGIDPATFARDHLPEGLKGLTVAQYEDILGSLEDLLPKGDREGQVAAARNQLGGAPGVDEETGVQGELPGLPPAPKPTAEPEQAPDSGLQAPDSGSEPAAEPEQAPEPAAAAPATPPEMRLHPNYVELSFPERPDAETRARLKELRFRWRGKDRSYRAALRGEGIGPAQAEARLAFARQIAGGPESPQDAPGTAIPEERPKTLAREPAPEPAPEEATEAAPEESSPVQQANPYTMSAEEVEAERERVRTREADDLVRALGSKEEAARWTRLERRANGTTDRARADAASEEMERWEAGLEDWQRRLIYGDRSDPRLSAEQYDDLSKALSIGAETAEDEGGRQEMFRILARGLPRVRPGTVGELEGLPQDQIQGRFRDIVEAVRIREAVRVLKEAGASDGQIIQGVVQRLRTEGVEAEDARVLLQDWLGGGREPAPAIAKVTVPEVEAEPAGQAAGGPTRPTTPEAPAPPAGSRGDIGGFTRYMGVARRKRAEDALQRAVENGDREIPRHQLVEEFIFDRGGRVVPHPKDIRRLQDRDGAFIEERRLTKTAMDYAVYLQDRAQEATPEPPAQPAEGTTEPPVAEVPAAPVLAQAPAPEPAAAAPEEPAPPPRPFVQRMLEEVTGATDDYLADLSDDLKHPGAFTFEEVRQVREAIAARREELKTAKAAVSDRLLASEPFALAQREYITREAILTPAQEEALWEAYDRRTSGMTRAQARESNALHAAAQEAGLTLTQLERVTEAQGYHERAVEDALEEDQLRHDRGEPYQVPKEVIAEYPEMARRVGRLADPILNEGDQFVGEEGPFWLVVNEAKGERSLQTADGEMLMETTKPGGGTIYESDGMSDREEAAEAFHQERGRSTEDIDHEGARRLFERLFDVVRSREEPSLFGEEEGVGAPEVEPEVAVGAAAPTPAAAEPVPEQPAGPEIEPAVEEAPAPTEEEEAYARGVRRGEVEYDALNEGGKSEGARTFNSFLEGVAEFLNAINPGEKLAAGHVGNLFHQIGTGGRSLEQVKVSLVYATRAEAERLASEYANTYNSPFNVHPPMGASAASLRESLEKGPAAKVLEKANASIDRVLRMLRLVREEWGPEAYAYARQEVANVEKRSVDFRDHWAATVAAAASEEAEGAAANQKALDEALPPERLAATRKAAASLRDRIVAMLPEELPAEVGSSLLGLQRGVNQRSIGTVEKQLLKLGWIEATEDWKVTEAGLPAIADVRHQDLREKLGAPMDEYEPVPKKAKLYELDETRGGGFYVGTFMGKPAYTNGIILLQGEPPVLAQPEGRTQPNLRELEPKGETGPQIEPVGYTTTVPWSSVPKITRAIFFDDGTAFNATLIDWIRANHPKARIYSSEKPTQARVIKEGNRIIGLVMPLRDATAPEGIQRLLDAAQAEKGPAGTPTGTPEGSGIAGGFAAARTNLDFEPRDATTSAEGLQRRLRPVAPPEIFQIARLLMGGKAPRLARGLRTALGMFKHSDGAPESYDILINPRAVKDERLLAQAIAHEFGHLADATPNATLRRGNLMGRIASLKSYMDKYLAGTEGGPGPLTDEDRARLREEAEKLSGTNAEKVIDEIIRRELPITPDEVLAIWRDATEGIRLKNRPLYDFVADAPAALKKAIMVAALKGQVHADLQRFSKVVEEKTGKQVTRKVPGKGSAAEIKRRYESLVAEEIEKRQLLSNETIREELKALSDWWTPWDRARASKGYARYRDSSRELYAQAFSVLLCSPGDLQERAPMTFRGLMNYIARKKDLTDAYLEIQDAMDGVGPGLGEMRAFNFRKMFVSTQERLDIVRAEQIAIEQDASMGVLGTLWQYVLYKFQPWDTKQDQLEKAGRRFADSENARYLLDELACVENDNHMLMQRTHDLMYRPLIDAGVTRHEIGEYLVLRRVVTERGEIGNPLMYTPGPSQNQIDDMRRRLGATRFALLEETMQRWHDMIFDIATRAVEAGVYSRFNYETLIVPNKDNYATFAVAHYLDGHISAKIHHQVGTFSDILNPLDATLMKTITLNRLIALNVAKRALVTEFQKSFPEQIEKVAIPYREKAPTKKPKTGYDYLILLEDGKHVAYEMPKQFVRAFERHDIGGLERFARMISTPFYHYIHPLLVTFSLGFQVANPIRDFGRTYTNLKSAGTEEYGRLVKDLMAQGLSEAEAKRAARPELITLGQVIAAYWKSMPNAWRRARNISDDLVTRMYEEKALTTPFVSMRVSELEQGEIGEAERLMHAHGMGTIDEQRHGVRRALGGIFNAVEGAGIFQETLGKAAGFRVLEEHGWAKHKRAFEVRNFVGTPNWKRGGLATPFTNAMFSYSRVRLNGTQMDYRQALTRGPAAAAAWWSTHLTWTVMPKVYMRMALAGMFGPATKALFDMIPDYYLANYDVPFAWFAAGDDDKEDKAGFITVPNDDQGRFLGAVVWHAIKEHPDSDSWINSMYDIFGTLISEAVPTVNPILNIPLVWAQYLSGVNPIDPHYLQGIIPRREWTANERLWPMIRWTGRSFGVLSSAWRGIEGVVEGVDRPGEITVESLPGVSRLLRYSNRGLSEKDTDAIAAEDAATQRFKNDLPYDVRSLTGQLYRLGRKRGTKGGLNAEELRHYDELNVWSREVYIPITQAMRAAQERGDKAAYDRFEKQLKEQSAAAARQQGLEEALPEIEARREWEPLSEMAKWRAASRSSAVPAAERAVARERFQELAREHGGEAGLFRYLRSKGLMDKWDDSERSYATHWKDPKYRRKNALNP